MYGHEVQAQNPPTHVARLKARSPLPLDSRSRGAYDSQSRDLRNGRPFDPYPAGTDDSGFDLPADDEADPDSDYGSYDGDE